MYVLQRLRYGAVISDIEHSLKDMALDPRSFPGLASELRPLKSSASTPSLRSRESELVPMGGNTPDNGGGNVRVVVRVRGFLPRGMLNGILWPQCAHVLQKPKEEQNAWFK